MRVEDKLGGTAEAGQPQEKKEETAQEYAARVMKGNLDDAKKEWPQN